MKIIWVLPLLTLFMALSGCVPTRIVNPPDEVFLPESDPRKIKHCANYYYSKSGWALCEILQSNSDRTCNTGIQSVLNDRGLKCDVYLPAQKTSLPVTPDPSSNKKDLQCKSKYSSHSQNQLCSTYWNNLDPECDKTIASLIAVSRTSESCRATLIGSVVPEPPPKISGPAPSIKETKPDSTKDHVQKQVPKVAQNSLKLLGTGSGFLVDRDKLITNHHVVEGCVALKIKSRDKYLDTALVSSDKNFDLALLKVEESIGAPLPIRSTALLGEEVMVAGYPLSGLLSKDIKVTSGEISSLAGTLNDSSRIQISAPIQPGNSGGPLIDNYGNIVGVVSAKLNDKTAIEVTGGIAQNVNFAIKPEILKLFLGANQVTSRLSASKAKLERVELAEKANRTTFQIFCLGHK